LLRFHVALRSNQPQAVVDHLSAVIGEERCLVVARPLGPILARTIDDYYFFDTSAAMVDGLFNCVVFLQVWDMEFLISDRSVVYKFLKTKPLDTSLIVGCSSPMEEDCVLDLIETSYAPGVVRHGSMEIGLRRSELLKWVCERYSTKDDEVNVIDAMDKHLVAYDFCKEADRKHVLDLWRKRHAIPAPLPRLQRERCSPPCLPEDPFLPLYNIRWKTWTDRYLGGSVPDASAPAVRKTLVLVPNGLAGGTTWARSHGPHVFLSMVVDNALLHDCLALDKEAMYIVLKGIPWRTLLNERSSVWCLVAGETSMHWKRGRQLLTTPLGLPVIVVGDCSLPKNDKAWGARGKEFWMERLEIVQLDADLPLFAASSEQPEKRQRTDELGAVDVQ
jgi:hypothetical protein